MSSDPPTAHPDRAPSRWPVVAAAVLALEALALVALAGVYAVGLGRHDEADFGRALASIALFIVGAGILASLARGWLRGQSWPRMATLVLNALLVPVAFSAIRTWGMLVGLPVLLIAIVGVVAALSSEHSDAA